MPASLDDRGLKAFQKEKVAQAKQLLAEAEKVTDETNLNSNSTKTLFTKEKIATLQKSEKKVQLLPQKSQYKNKDYFLSFIKSSHSLYKFREEVDSEQSDVEDNIIQPIQKYSEEKQRRQRRIEERIREIGMEDDSS